MSDDLSGGTTARVHPTVADRLRAIHQRYTPNRRALVDVLIGIDRPMSIGQILAARSGLRQSSVYRNLQALERAGVVRRVSGGDDFGRYELAENLIGHHHHLVCSSCGSVEDFTAPPELERAMARAMSHVGRSKRFATQLHQVELHGRCRACSQ